MPSSKTNIEAEPDGILGRFAKPSVPEIRYLDQDQLLLPSLCERGLMENGIPPALEAGTFVGSNPTARTILPE